MRGNKGKNSSTDILSPPPNIMTNPGPATGYDISARILCLRGLDWQVSVNTQ